MGAGRDGLRDAGDSPDERTNSRLAKIDPVTSKCQIRLSRHFEPSIIAIAQALDIGQDAIDDRIDDFIEFKVEKGCGVSFTSYGEDKSSGINLKGEEISHFWMTVSLAL